MFAFFSTIKKNWVPTVVILGFCAFITALIIVIPKAQEAHRLDAIEAVQAACGEGAAVRFEAFLDSGGNDEKPREEASSWATRCATK